MFRGEELEAFLQKNMFAPILRGEMFGEKNKERPGEITLNDTGKVIKKIAVLMPNWISDFVMALSVITRKAGESDLEITLIVSEHLISLCKVLTTLPYIVYKRKNGLQFMDSAAQIRESGFDKLYILPHSFSSAWFGLRTGVPVSRGVSAEQRSQFLTETISSGIISTSEHMTKEYSYVLETGFVDPSEWPGITINIDEQYIDSIVLCPGCNESSRRWTGYEELVKLWPEQHFVIVGDSHELEITKNIGKRLPHRVENLTGKTTIEQAASILAAASVVIANDSGLMHLAGYLGVPIIGIFGSTSPVWRKPLGNTVHCITPSYSCSPCYKRECQKKNPECMLETTPEMVIGLALEIMRKSESYQNTGLE